MAAFRKILLYSFFTAADAGDEDGNPMKTNHIAPTRQWRSK
jgi:hypothetical protein